MGRTIDKITIEGFKSIESLKEFKLAQLNILIGANGAGKSNFVEFFRMLRAMADEGFQRYVLEAGGGDEFLFMGPKKTKQVSSRLVFGQNWYANVLQPTHSGSLIIGEETTGYGTSSTTVTGLKESRMKARKDERSLQNSAWPGVGKYIYEAISSWTVYHFHDTSSTAAMRRDQSLNDYERFRPDASNIAAFLFNLEKVNKESYEAIRDTVRLIAPYFDDFLLRPKLKGDNELVRLEWKQEGNSFPFQPSQLSDGTIRFICLATALLQPDRPTTVVIDEPELGLHPYAITILAEMIKACSISTQIIISTQSPSLLDHFEPEEIIVVDRERGRSTFTRLKQEKLNQWLDDYSMGQLWQKNIYGGGPSHE